MRKSEFIGYVRCLKEDEQSLSFQYNTLQKMGCLKIYVDKLNHTKDQRLSLNECIKDLNSRDTLVITSLDRLAVSIKDLILISNKLKSGNVNLLSLTDSINTSKEANNQTFNFFELIARFEYNLVIEKTNKGLKSARARGRTGGRPPKLDFEKSKLIKQLHDNPDNTIDYIVNTMGISRGTMYKYLNKLKNNI